MTRKQPKPVPRCELCIWSHWFDGNGESDCRRKSPWVAKDICGITRREWPRVMRGDWCGEFQPKEDRK